MISPQLIRRYPFFAGLSYEHISKLAKLADDMWIAPDHYFFHEGDKLSHLYLTVEGEVAVVVSLPRQDVIYKLSDLLTHDLQTQDVAVITIMPGEVFAWSALVPPYTATSSAKALTSCRVLAFDSSKLRRIFDEDCQFGYHFMQKIAQIIRSRLRAMRTETLSHLVT